MVTGVMNKKPILHSIFIFVAAVPSIAAAQAVITEVMYDPKGVDSGHEWIEVYNVGTTSIALSTWKVNEGGANHNIIASSGGASIATGTYAVIAENAADFRSDYPEYSGALFHAAFSLDNGGATLTLKDKSLDSIDTVSYDSAWGGLGDGNSLQRPPGESGEFAARAPSPGAAMPRISVVPANAPPSATAAAPTSPASPAKISKLKRSSSAQKSASDSSAARVRVSNDAGNRAVVSPQSAPSLDSGIPSYWFVALGAIVLLAIGAIATSRHRKKDEWDIVEENPEGV